MHRPAHDEGLDLEADDFDPGDCPDCLNYPCESDCPNERSDDDEALD